MTSSGAYNAADALRSYKISVTSRTTSDPQKPGLLSLSLRPVNSTREPVIASHLESPHAPRRDTTWRRTVFGKEFFKDSK